MPPDEAPAVAPAPASTPEPSTPAPAPSSSPEPAGAEFAGLGEDFDDTVEVEIPAEPSKEGEAPPAEPPKPAEPAPAEAPKPAEAAKPKEAAPPAAGPKEQVPPAPSEPRGLVEQLGQHRTEILDELAKTRFAWDKGEEKAFTDALDVDATKALVEFAPKMMARIYYDSVTAALNHINQFVPVLINNFTRAQKQQEEAEKAFFGQFPQIKKEQHWNDVINFANIFRQQNPQLTQQDLLAMVGAAVMAKNKLNGIQAPASPRRQATPPFVPAQAGSGPVRVKTEPESPYAGLGEDFED